MGNRRVERKNVYTKMLEKCGVVKIGIVNVDNLQIPIDIETGKIIDNFSVVVKSNGHNDISNMEIHTGIHEIPESVKDRINIYKREAEEEIISEKKEEWERTREKWKNVIDVIGKE